MPVIYSSANQDSFISSPPKRAKHCPNYEVSTGPVFGGKVITLQPARIFSVNFGKFSGDSCLNLNHPNNFAKNPLKSHIDGIELFHVKLLISLG